MTIIDAGAILAILNARDPDHRACVAALGALSPPLVTTWPALTEAMYLLEKRTGWLGVEKLWRLIGDGRMIVESLDEAGVERARVLMKKYRDLPMDLADATLVVVMEVLGQNRIMSLDAHFEIYRLNGRQRIDMVP